MSSTPGNLQHLLVHRHCQRLSWLGHTARRSRPSLQAPGIIRLKGWNVNFPARVTVCEVGPRDGLQSERPIPLQEKVKLINLLSETGIRVIEVTSFVHPKAVPQLADAEEVIGAIQKAPGVTYRALALNPKGVERAIQSGVDQIKVAISATDTHSQRNANRTVQQAMDSIYQMVTLATDAGVPVAGSIAVAFCAHLMAQFPCRG